MEAAAGLAAMGFWIFLAAVVVAGIWFDARKRESQQETLRRIVESGQHIEPEIVDKMLESSGDNKRTDRELKVAGLITMFAAPGLAAMGYFMSSVAEELFGIFLGIGALAGIVGFGLFVAGSVYERWNREDQGR